MYKLFNNKFKILFIIVAVVFITTMSFSKGHQPKHNFKILPQNISRDSLHAIMHDFSISLGVRCGFCHAKSSMDTTKLDFASDANDKKDIAREMMKMTTDINLKYFSDTSFNPKLIQIVTCATCHNGHEEPPKETAKDDD